MSGKVFHSSFITHLNNQTSVAPMFRNLHYSAQRNRDKWPCLNASARVAISAIEQN